MPNASKDFRVGILAFRNGVVDRFPITPILPTYEDEGRSQKSVLEFLQNLSVEKSATDHLPVFREAFAMLQEAHPTPDAKRKERIIVLSDVGPSELDKQPGYSQAERETKDLITHEATEWAGNGNRAIEALFVESNYTAQDPATDEHREWFKSLGNVSPKSAFYTDGNALLRAILHASIE